MTIAALADYRMFRHPYPLDLGNRMTGETIASAIGHFGRVGTVTLDTRRHRFVTMIAIDVFEQCRVTGHTIPRTSP